jgi:hypothetical protein
MNRRNFLKLMAIVPAAAAVPSLVLASEDEYVTQNHQVLSRVRETWANDIYRDETIVRHDVMWPGEMIGVDQAIKGGVTEEKKREARDIAVKLLAGEMRARGISPSDLIQLPSIQ